MAPEMTVSSLAQLLDDTKFVIATLCVSERVPVHHDHFHPF